MKIRSQSSISFFSDQLNQEKYNALMAKAIKIKDFKNQLSKKIASNYLDYIDLSKFDIIKQENTQIDGLTGQEIQLAIQDVCTAYENKFDQINQLIKFKNVVGQEITYYKKNGKTFQKGDIKSVEVKYKTSPLCSVLGYIAKTKFTTKEEVIGYLETARIPKITNLILEETNEKKQKTLQNLLALFILIIDKLNSNLGNRILSYAIEKRNQVFEKNSNPIEFKSLSYRSLNRISSPIVDFNQNKKSEIQAFISLGGFDEYKTLDIPVAYSRQYHGKIGDYKKQLSEKQIQNKKEKEQKGEIFYQPQTQVSYLVCFVRGRIRIIVTKEIEREYVNFELDEAKILGVDVNIKHNMFACSDGKTFDFNRSRMANLAKLLTRIDSNKKGKTKEEKAKITEFYQDRIDKWQRRYKAEMAELSSELTKHMVANGFNHVVMEELKQMGRMFSKEENTELKYSRIARILHLNSLDQVVASICSKKELQFSNVHASYTSQECPRCGWVSRGNRTCQEKFVCEECGYAENADIKSAKTIKKRVASDVHRNKLIAIDEKSGWFKPKPMSNKKIKDFLLDLFDTSSSKTYASRLE